nr:YicC family protein [Desulfobacula sp.]
MIKSMTAFSQASHTVGAITADVTLRSYNSKTLDLTCHCPESCQALEEDIRKIIAKTHDRGRIEIRLSIRDEAKDLEQFDVDLPKALSYYQALKKIKEDLNLSSDISLDQLLAARNIIVPSRKEADMESLRQAVAPCVETACAALDLMRRQEGKNLHADLTSRMDDIEKRVQEIEAEAKGIPLVYKQRLMERIAWLTADAEGLDPVRISQEAAILADKSDVTEEITRLYSHIGQFRQVLESEEPGGRKLNFLIQEFNREFNTIGSKAGNASLSHRVVELKSELEKIREQVQNIE